MRSLIHVSVRRICLPQAEALEKNYVKLNFEHPPMHVVRRTGVLDAQTRGAWAFPAQDNEFLNGRIP
jgi:hypothetical protein